MHAYVYVNVYCIFLGKVRTLLEWAVVLLSKKWSVWSGVGDGWILGIRLL